tara:strand:- start:407 stop:622 length:216 start_codon:yes stop_codon:yes gene_type:complete
MLVSNNRSHFYEREENVKEAVGDFLRILFLCFFNSILPRELTLDLKIRMAGGFETVVLFAEYDNRFLIYYS